MQTGNKFFKY